MAAVTLAHALRIVLDLLQQALLLQLLHHGLAGLVAFEALEGAAVLVDVAVGGEDVDFLQPMALAGLVVVGVVGGRDLHHARSELAVDEVVGDDRDAAVDQRQDDVAADEVAVAVVGGVDGDGGVAEHRLGAGGGDHGEPAGHPLDGVAHVPQLALLVGVLHLVVGQGGPAAHAPVDEVVAAVDEALAVEAAEHGAHGARESVVQREALAAPVARAAHALELVDDDASVLVAPFPDPLEEGVAPEGVARAALLQQGALHHVLRGDAGVVGAGQPQGVVARHAPPADERVLERVVEGVAHVQDARDVGRRDDDGVGGLVRVGVGGEAAGLVPQGVPFRLGGVGLVAGGEFHSRGVSRLPGVGWQRCCSMCGRAGAFATAITGGRRAARSRAGMEPDGSRRELATAVCGCTPPANG